jgi:hypothetical protein
VPSINPSAVNGCLNGEYSRLLISRQLWQNNFAPLISSAVTISQEAMGDLQASHGITIQPYTGMSAGVNNVFAGMPVGFFDHSIEQSDVYLFSRADRVGVMASYQDGTVGMGIYRNAEIMRITTSTEVYSPKIELTGEHSFKHLDL